MTIEEIESRVLYRESIAGSDESLTSAQIEASSGGEKAVATARFAKERWPKRSEYRTT
jgi:hypothetical protein